MRNRKLLVACSCIVGASLFGGTDFVDFRTDRTAEGWELGNTVYNRDRGRKFVADGDAITSPAAASAVTSATVVVSFTVSNAPVPRFHVLAGPDDEHLGEVDVVTNRIVNLFTTNRFSFAEADQVRILRIVADRNGNDRTNPFVVAAGFGLPPDPEPPPLPEQIPPPLRLSTVPPGAWQETFDSCTNLFPGTANSCAWSNGVTLPPWQAFQDGEAPTTLARNKGGKASVGLYAYWASNEVVRTYALGMNVGSEAKACMWGVVFANDTVRRLKEFSLGYTGRQFGFHNTAAQTVSVEWLVTNALVGVDVVGAWNEVPSLTFTTPAIGRGDELVSGVAPPVETRLAGALDGVRVEPGELLLIRWRRTHVTNAAALGVDDVQLTWTRAREPMLLLVR